MYIEIFCAIAKLVKLIFEYKTHSDDGSDSGNGSCGQDNA